MKGQTVKAFLIPAICTLYLAGILYYWAYGNNVLWFNLEYGLVSALCLFFLFAQRTKLNCSFVGELLGINIVMHLYSNYCKYAKYQFIELHGKEAGKLIFDEFIAEKTWLLAAFIASFHIGFVIFTLYNIQSGTTASD